jgi:hypothetical protein
MVVVLRVAVSTVLTIHEPAGTTRDAGAESVVVLSSGVGEDLEDIEGIVIHLTILRYNRMSKLAPYELCIQK